MDGNGNDKEPNFFQGVGIFPFDFFVNKVFVGGIAVDEVNEVGPEKKAQGGNEDGLEVASPVFDTG